MKDGWMDGIFCLMCIYLVVIYGPRVYRVRFGFANSLIPSRHFCIVSQLFKALRFCDVRTPTTLGSWNFAFVQYIIQLLTVD